MIMPTPNKQDRSRNLTIEPAACYWGLIDVRVLPVRQRSDARRLGYLFEGQLPCAIDKVHAVFARVDADHVIGCALSKDRLSALVEGGEEAPLTLLPSAMPVFVSKYASVAAGKLNLLTGEFEPAFVRKARRRLTTQVFVIVAMITALVTLGLERRRLMLAYELDSIQATSRQVMDESLGPGSGVAALPPEQRLVSMLRRLEQTRALEMSAPVAEHRDPAATLFDVLALWPDDLHVQTELISIAQQSVTIKGLLPESGDAQVLADALDVIDGWTVRQPTVSTTRNGVQTTLTLQPESAEEQP